MKRALFFLLALAVCLSACTSAPESEAGGEVMDATVENAVPAEESASSAAPVAGGAIWGDNCQADSGHAWYTVNPVGDENGIRQVQLLRLDYNTGKQDCLCTIDASPQQVGEPLARDGMVYLVLDQTLYRISEEDGQMETVPLERPVFPMIADGTYGYDYTFDAGANNIQLSRLDLQTGEITLLSMPAQTQGIWAVGEPRLLVCNLATDAPLPSVEQGEQYAAAIQSADCVYSWYDPATGATEKLLEEPYYGIEQEDGSRRHRSFLGMADGRLYFSWVVSKGEGPLDYGMESCDAQGQDWQALPDAPVEGEAIWSLQQQGECRWVLGGRGTGAYWIYDLTTGQYHEMPHVTAIDYWPCQLFQNGKVLLKFDGENGQGELIYGLMDVDAYLAGSTDWTPIEDAATSPEA